LNHKSFFCAVIIFSFVFGGWAQKNKKEKKDADTVAYYWENIIIPDTVKMILNTVNVTFPKGKIKSELYVNFCEKVLNHLENNGFPFAQIYMEDLTLDDKYINGRLQIDKNQKIVFDSIVIHGNANIAVSFLRSYLGFKKKKNYSESKIQNIPRLLEELPYIKQFQESSVVFEEDKAHLYLYADKRKTNQFDGFLALVPVDEITGKIALAGELNLKLQNVFKIAETLDMKWKAPGSKSQNLRLNLIFPYLFKTPLGVEGLFYLDKRDTTYLNMNYRVGLLFSFLGNNYIKAVYNYATSNVLVKDVKQVLSKMQISDYKTSSYGIDFAFRKLDFLFNPKKGYDLRISTDVGVRQIVKNNQVENSYYDTLQMKTMRYRLAGHVAGYLPISKHFVIHGFLDGATMFGGQNFLNELYRIGGMKSLRGFDEESISASSYTIANVEFRFIFSKFSYITAFFNAAWYEKNLKHDYFKDFPYGFGLGIAFDTPAGIFGLSYALGSQQGNPLSFKSGKIHLGMNLMF